MIHYTFWHIDLTSLMSWSRSAELQSISTPSLEQLILNKVVPHLPAKEENVSLLIHLDSSDFLYFIYMWHDLWTQLQDLLLTFLLLIGDDPIHFVGFWDVQLGTFCDFLKVWTFIECTSQSGFPRCRFSFIPFFKFSLKHCPGLHFNKVIITYKANAQEQHLWLKVW